MAVACQCIIASTFYMLCVSMCVTFTNLASTTTSDDDECKHRSDHTYTHTHIHNPTSQHNPMGQFVINGWIVLLNLISHQSTFTIHKNVIQQHKTTNVSYTNIYERIFFFFDSYTWRILPFFLFSPFAYFAFKM